MANMKTTHTTTQAGERTQEEDRMQFQSRFVADLIDNVRTEILNKLARYEVPESWGGIELRKYIADKFRQDQTNMKPSDHEIELEPGPPPEEDRCPVCQKFDCVCPPESM